MTDENDRYDEGFEAGVESMRGEYDYGHADGYSLGHHEGYNEGYETAKTEFSRKAPSEFAEPFGDEVE